MEKFVEVDHIFIDNDSKTCEDALRFIADKSYDLGAVENADNAYVEFQNREKQDSTGLVGGIAIPHAMCDCVKSPCVIVVKYPTNMQWETKDNSEVKLAIALLIPKDQDGVNHLKNLSKIARLILKKDICGQLLNAEDSQTLADVINSNI